ncbi:DUF4179 domain-containing protein [Saccharibacillus sacchari]|uniref:DUF4179 domain-containing protein n=1 Tax=Saccharibacillus sacchari TaxID=456493 RepID=UPI0004AD19D9|nr:DUF4179 domain-containing protein [Saccharibacillus sacchari]
MQMNDHLEKRIRQDAETLRHPSTLPSAGERSAAIRRGMQRANNERPRGKRIIYGGVAAVAIAAGVLLFADSGPLQGVFGNSGTHQSSFLPEADKWEPFLKLLNGNDGLSSAWKQGFVEPVDAVSVEENGMNLKIEGMIRDSRSVTLLYKLKSPEGEAAEWDTPKLLDAFYGKETTTKNWIHRTYFNTGEGATYGYATLFFSGEARSRAEDFNLKVDALSLQSPDQDKSLGTFVVPLRLPSTLSQEQELVYDQPKQLIVSGQTIQVHRMLLTPLSVYLNVSEDPDNTDKLFDLIEPTLTLEQDEQTFKLQKPGVPSLIEGRLGWEMSFVNHAGIVNPDALSFGVSGIQSLSKEQLNLVLNTEEESVLQAPEDGFALQVTQAKANAKQIAVHYPVHEDEFGRLGSMRLDPVFKDGNGKEHEMVSSEGAMQTGKGDSQSASDTFYIPDQDYPQPLTFTISMYPGGIRDEQEVVLK